MIQFRLSPSSYTIIGFSSLPACLHIFPTNSFEWQSPPSDRLNRNKREREREGERSILMTVRHRGRRVNISQCAVPSKYERVSL